VVRQQKATEDEADNKKVGGTACHCSIGWVTADYGRVLIAEHTRQAERDKFKLSSEISMWVAAGHQSGEKDWHGEDNQGTGRKMGEQNYRSPPVFVGHDQDLGSWGVDGVNQMKWHGLGETWGREWKKNDIIGIALDLDSPRPYIMYSLNGDFGLPMGRAFTLPPTEAGSNGLIGSGLLPALSLTLGSAVRVNFGTAAFTFQPPTPEYLGVAMSAEMALSGIGGGGKTAVAAGKEGPLTTSMQIAQKTSVLLQHKLTDACVGLVLKLVDTLPEQIEALFRPVEALAEFALSWDTSSKTERISSMIDALRQTVSPFVGGVNSKGGKIDHSDLVEASMMAADGEFGQVAKLLLAKAVKMIEAKAPMLSNTMGSQSQSVKVDSLVEGLAMAVADGNSGRIPLVLGQFAVEVAFVASPNLGMDSRKARCLAEQLAYLFERRHLIIAHVQKQGQTPVENSGPVMQCDVLDFGQLRSVGRTILELLLPKIHSKLRSMLEAAFTAGCGDFTGVKEIKHRFEGLAMLCTALQASSMRSTTAAENQMLLQNGLQLTQHLTQSPNERWAFILSRAAVLLKHSNALAPELIANALQMSDDQQTILEALFAIATDDELAILRCIEGFAAFGGVNIEIQKIRHRLLLMFYSLVRGSPHDTVAVRALKDASIQSETSGLSAKKQKEQATAAAAKQQMQGNTNDSAGDDGGGAGESEGGDHISASGGTVYMVAPRGANAHSVALKPDNERLVMRMICISHGGQKYIDGVDELLNRCGLPNRKKRMYVAVGVACDNSVHGLLGKDMKAELPAGWLSTLHAGTHPDVDDEDRVTNGAGIVTLLLESVSTESKADMRLLLNKITGLTIRKTVEKTIWDDIKIDGVLSLVYVCITMRELEDKFNAGEYAAMRHAVSIRVSGV
jgi:hypothetical protein